MRAACPGAALALAALLLGPPVGAGDAGADPAAPPTGLPFADGIEVAFRLTDQNGHRVSERDYLGRPVALFFGYASCDSICTVALPRMAEALDLVGEAGAEIVPLMITVDPARDTPAAMRARLPLYHPRLVGLTGSADDLADVRARFQVEVSQVAEDPTGAPIYAHGSFIYLIGRSGRVRSVVPPILGPERIAELMIKYF